MPFKKPYIVDYPYERRNLYKTRAYFSKSVQGIFCGVDCIHIAGMDELGM